MKLAKTATLNQLDLAKLGLSRMTSKGNLYEPSTKGKVTHEGYMYKKSPGGIPLMRHWHKRWFVLESPGKLLYFTDQTKNDLKGIIPLDMVEKMLYRSTRLTLLMEATEDSPSRKFSLKADSDGEIKTWTTAINAAFEELDKLEEEADQKVAAIGEGDAKYWKPQTRKKLNLSVALDDKSKKKGLNVDPRAKDLAASPTPAGIDASTSGTDGYAPLKDDHVDVSSTLALSSSEDASEDYAREIEQQRRLREQEEHELSVALAASEVGG